MTYDVIVIGGGPGGYAAAIRAAQMGGKVALVESSYLGGTCLNRGCIPSKAFLHLVSESHHDRASGAADALYQTFAKKSQGVVDQLRHSLTLLIKTNAVEVFTGRGSLTGEKGGVEVKDTQGRPKKWESRCVVLAMGSAPHALPLFPLDEKTVLSSDGVLAMNKLPKVMLVVGGGAVGTEWAYVLNGLGVHVKIVEALQQLLPYEDAAAAKVLENALRKQGIDILLGTQVKEAKKDGSGWHVRIQDKMESFEKILVAVGRRPLTTGIGLEKLGVLSERGFVKVDEHMRTAIPWLYAIGDVTGISMLAHAAIAQGRCAAGNAMGVPQTFDKTTIARCVYTIPEVASVGFSEADARAAGMSVVSGKFPYAALGKAHCIGQTEGFFKVVAEEKTRRIVGVQIVGYGATDLISEACVLLKMKATLKDIIDTVHPHPTLSEGLWEAACAADGQGLHSASRRKTAMP